MPPEKVSTMPENAPEDRRDGRNSIRKAILAPTPRVEASLCIRGV